MVFYIFPISIVVGKSQTKEIEPEKLVYYMYRIVEIEHFIPHLVHKHPTLCT